MADPKGFMTTPRETPKRRPVDVRIKDWREVYEPQSFEHLQKQAGRCMDCGTPFCHNGCPLGNIIPEFNDAVYSGKVKLRPNYISCTPGVFSFISGTAGAVSYNNSTTATFNLTLANKQYMLIDDAYLYVELETTTSSALTTPATFIKPNILASMVQNITISTKDFTYTSTNFNKYRWLIN